jgi:hypothetical protein
LNLQFAKVFNLRTGNGTEFNLYDSGKNIHVCRYKEDEGEYFYGFIPTPKLGQIQEELDIDEVPTSPILEISNDFDIGESVSLDDVIATLSNTLEVTSNPIETNNLTTEP